MYLGCIRVIWVSVYPEMIISLSYTLRQKKLVLKCQSKHIPEEFRGKATTNSPYDSVRALDDLK